MNQIPVILAQCPRILKVSRGIKVTIFRAVLGLDIGEVHSGHEAVGIFVGNINSPNSGATAQVQHTRSGGMGCIYQAVANSSFGNNFVEQIKAVLLLVVAWQHINASSVSMICPPVFQVTRVLFWKPFSAQMLAAN
jgi:hypothetical protein